MTVTYYPHIATVQKGVLFRLLLRWKGSLYKLVLPEIVVFLILYLTLSVIYRCALNIEQKQSFESLCMYLRSHLNATSITFSLGFFVSYVMNRWWETFRTMPWLYTPAFVIRQVVRPLHYSPEPTAQHSDSKTSLHNHSVQSANKMMNNNLHQPAGVTAEQQNVANDMISAITQKVPVGAHSQEVANCVGTNFKGLTMRKLSTVVSPAITNVKDSQGMTVAGSAAHIADTRRQADEDAMSVRLALMRYLLLGWIFAIRRISKPVMVRFMPPGKFADATLREKLEMLNADPYIQRFVDPLITDEEQDAIMAYARLIHGNDAATYEPDHYVPLSWAADLVHEAYQRGLITSRHLVNELNSTFKEFRGGLGMLRFMDQFNIPLVYTQVVALSMYMYFVVLCFSEQFLEKRPPQLPSVPGLNETVVPIVPQASNDMDYYVPWPSVLYLTFVLGWLRVAEVCLNPFGEDDDDFPTWQILNMNIETAYKMINVHDIDRVYDGSLREHRARRGGVTTIGNNILETASHQRSQRHRRVSAHGGRSRRASFSPASSAVISPHLHEKDSVSHHGKLSDAEVLMTDEEVDSEIDSDGYSSYFNEQLETVRRSKYEHMRKKYERPIYQGSAIESEIGQNPATSNPASESSGMTRNMSRLSNIKHQLGSTLHLPSLQRHPSRSTVTNPRIELAEDSASHVLIVPDTHSQSATTVQHKRSVFSNPVRRESAVVGSTQPTPTSPWWRRVSESHTPLNYESVSTAASPSIADQRKLLNDDNKRRPSGQLSNNLHSSHPQLSDLDVSMNIVGGRSSSHVELSQAARDTAVAQESANISTSSATPVRVVKEDSTPVSQPSAPADLNSTVFIVGSRRNLNRIVETAETDADAQSQLGKRKTDGRQTDSETNSSASGSNMQTTTEQALPSIAERSLSDADGLANSVNTTPLIFVEQTQENQQSTSAVGSRRNSSAASSSSPGPRVYFEAES